MECALLPSIRAMAWCDWRYYLRSGPGLVLVLMIIVQSACSDKTSTEVNFVIVGDSLSAGHQNGCTIYSQQEHGYAKLLANQAGWRMDMPLIGSPGVRPCMEILVTGDLSTIKRMDVGGDPNDESTWGNRIEPAVQSRNLGIPGTRIVDAFSAPPDNSYHPLFDLDYRAVWNRFMDTPDKTPDQSMINVAYGLLSGHDRDRDVAILWLGSNDVLWSSLAGIDTAVTPMEFFEPAYDGALGTLAATGAELVVANIPDLTTAPHYIPVETALAFFGTDLATVGGTLVIEAGALVTLRGLNSIYEILVTGTLSPPLADSDFLTAAEADSLSATIAAYNAYIAEAAATYGAVLVDIATLLVDAKFNGYTVGADTLTTDYCGGLFSLDGVHPSHTGYAIIANEFIATMNTGLGYAIPFVDLADVRANEPSKNSCVASP